MDLKDNKDMSAADSFVVHMVRTPTSPAAVASVEVVTQDMRNRYSFRDPRNIEDTFVPEMADRLTTALARVHETGRLVLLPNFCIELPNVMLSEMRVMVTRADDGTDYIMMRFRRYVGAIKSAFRFDTEGTVESPAVREKIAVEVLNDIVTPLFDLMSLGGNGLEDVVENYGALLNSRIQELTRRQKEVTFYITMLQRYVAGCQQDQKRSNAKHVTNAQYHSTLIQ